MTRRSRCRRRAAPGGFTLLEVLIGIALLTALLGAMFAFLFHLLSARRRALDHVATQLAATTLIDRAEQDLMSSVVGDPFHGAGVEGDNSSLRVLTRGVAAYLASRGAGDPAALGDLQIAEYRFDEGARQIEARRTPAGDRRGEPEAYAPLGGAVYKVRFRYHDTTAWRDTYDSLAEDRLPLAVEIAVWFYPWPGAGETVDDDPPDRPQRLTFDASGAFDEVEYARRSEAELFDEPLPDRIRVILVPDAAADDPYLGYEDEMLALRGAQP